MKSGIRSPHGALLPLLLILCGTAKAQIPAIPEPGLVMYGTLLNTNAAGSNTLTMGTLSWTVSGNNSTSVVPATIIGVNGQFFYLARVPFETRHLGAVTFAATTNSLELSAVGATYNRSVLVNGSPAAIAFSSRGYLGTFPFGAADRGVVERVDLALNLNQETFTQWALRIFGTSNIDPNADADGDGMSNYQEYLAGTDPRDPHSALAMSDVRPDPRGGISISWQTVPGKTYAVFRSSALDRGFAPLQTGIAATSTTSSFYDATASGAGPYFYRVGLETN